jgi:hypothetical protein
MKELSPNMKGTIFMCSYILLIILMASFSSASFLPHQQNTQLNFSITSNFATNCTLTTINTPSSIITIDQVVTATGTYAFSINGSNFTSLGTYCANIICTDGTQTTSGQECRDVTLSGIERNTTLMVANIFLILLIIAVMYILHYKYKNTDYEESNNKIAEEHNSNWGRTFIKTLGNNLMRNSFLWYYCLGWLLLIVLKELVYVFSTQEIYSFFLLVLDIYSFGFFLVIVVWIGILIHHFRFITDLVNDLNLGVNVSK